MIMVLNSLKYIIFEKWNLIKTNKNSVKKINSISTTRLKMSKMKNDKKFSND